MKSLAEQIGGKCCHFNGMSNKACDMGIVYDEVRDDSKEGFGKFPCWREGEAVPCVARKFPTPEEVAAEVEAIQSHSAKMMKAMAAAMADAKSKGLKKGNGGAGKVPCPCCDGGTLSYSVASYNGHVWGKCSTDGCAAWMQ